ncbi:MAG: polymer-forming cytoskeletal protein [Brevinematia bacterium]
MIKIPYSIDDFMVKTVMKNDIYSEGEIRFSTSLRIDCNFKGNIISENGFVIIGPTSTVIGNITAGTIMVAGKVIGDLTATKKVELFSKSEVIGSIKAPKFRMEDDVKFEGDCDIFYEDDREVQNG